MMIEYPAILNPTPTIVRNLSSPYIAQEYQLFISLPLSYVESDRSFPVLYLLDGNLTYPLVRPIVELQQVLQRVPELIIVGIGYPVASYAATVALRGRDLTPIELTPEQKAGDYPFEETGGGPQFRDFLAHELVPFIDQNFRTDQNARTLAGYSLSATFVLYTMFQHPALFQHLIAISPSIESILEMENAYAKVHSSLPIGLFLSMESPLDEPQTQQWIESGRHFLNTLNEREYAGLNAKLHIFEGTDHVSVAPTAFTHAIRDIYQ